MWDTTAHARTLTGAFAGSAKRLPLVDTLNAYALSPATLPLTLNSAPHLFGNAKALAATTLVARARIRSGKRLVADGTWGGLAAVACGLVKVTREVTRGAELKVALGALVLGLGIRVLHDHPRMWGRVCFSERVGRGREGLLGRGGWRRVGREER